MGRALVAVVCVAGLAGCYRTAEMTGPAPEPGARILAELTAAGTAQMEPLIGPDAVGIEARVAEVRPEGWQLSLLRVDHRNASSARWNGEPVLFPSELFRGVQERRLDAFRTGAFTAGLGAVLYVLARNFMAAWIDPGDSPPEPPPAH